MRDSWGRAVRWLVAALAVLTIVAQPVLAGAGEPIAKPGACCNKCQCCVSGNPGGAPQPGAPVPARTTAAKDYQLVPVLHAALFSTPAVSTPIPFDFSAHNFPATVPVFIRHCTFQI